MAEYVLSNYDFDKIVFIPAANPPHKSSIKELDLHRLNLVKLATAYNENFTVSDIEYKLGGKSYSYRTALELYKIYKPEGKISFIIGSDAFEKIETWFMSEKFKKLVDFIVFVRENNFNPDKFDNLKSKGYSYKLANLDFFDISSTQIRKMVANREDVTNFIGKEEKEYIEKYGLYNG